MPRPTAIGLRPLTASLLLAWLLPGLGCKEEPPVERHYPMRNPPAADAAPPEPDAATTPGAETAGAEHDDGAETGAPGDDAPPLAERPPPDPAIERALDLISTSGRRFIDQNPEPEGRASEYTAEQFASMLRSKWDWIGYDLTELDPWLDAIATRSFKSNLPYQVVLDDGSLAELRPWLDAQLAASEAAGRPSRSDPHER